MKLLNERNQIKTAIENWIANYGLESSYGADKRKRHVGRELLALDQETATAQDVAAIIGNESWVCQRACNECGAKTWGIVEVGDDDDSVWICADCLRAALKLIEE